MGGSKKLHRWRLSLRRSSSEAAEEPPQEFLCPISNSLMFDPVVVSSGQTFERMSVGLCRDLGFTPTLPDGSRPDFSTAIPNLALKTAILNWCSKTGSERPHPTVYSEIESIVRSLMGSPEDGKSSEIRGSERELPHPATELDPRNLYASSSSEESVVANPFACASSPSTSSEFVPDEASSNNVSSASSGEDENFVAKMKSLDVYEQEQAVILLRNTTRNNKEARAALCSDRLVSALKQLLISRYSAVQTNATAALVNLSLERGNKVKIVRAGVVPLLIDILRNGFDEAREHAAGAIFSLALDDENKTAIGVLGALQPLLHQLRSGTRRSRHDAAFALYHLTLVQTNREKLVKLGAAGALLGLLKDAEVASRVVLVLCNLAACGEGRLSLLDANAVEYLVGALRSGAELKSESARENCVAALYLLSQGSIRFRGQAREAGAAEVLREVAENGSEPATQKAKQILEGLREPTEEEEKGDWEAVMKGAVSKTRFRVGRPNSE